MKLAPLTRGASYAILSLLACTTITQQSARAAGANDRGYIVSVTPGSTAPAVNTPFVFTFTNYSKGNCPTCTPIHFIQQVQLTVPTGFTLTPPQGSTSAVTSVPSNWMVQSISNAAQPVITFVTKSSTDTSFVVGEHISVTVWATYTGPLTGGCTAQKRVTWPTAANQSTSGGVGNAFSLESGFSDPVVVVASTDCLAGTKLTLDLVTSNGNTAIKTTDTTASVTLTATLTNNSGTPIGAEPISFTVGGNSITTCNAVTNASGVATCTYSPQQSPYTPLQAGSWAAVANFAGDTAPTPDWAPTTSAPVDLIVNTDGTALTVENATGNYGGTVNLSAQLTSGSLNLANKTIAFYLNGNPVGTAVTNISGVASVSNVSIAGIPAGPAFGAITAKFTTDGVYSSVEGSGDLQVNPIDQPSGLSLVAASPLTYNTSETLSYTGGVQGGSVVYSLVSGPCTLLGSTLTATSGTGTCAVKVTMSAQNYNDQIATANVTLKKADQVITFGPLSDLTYPNGLDFTVGATASSNLPVSFTAGPVAVCSVTGTSVHVIAVGQCTVTAWQAGDPSNWNAAPSVPQSFQVNAGTMPALGVTADSPLTFNQTEPLGVTGGVSGGTVVYTVTNGPCAIVSGTSLKANSGTGTCTVQAKMSAANYNDQTGSTTVTLQKAAQALTITAFTVTAKSDNNLPVTFGTLNGAICIVGSPVAGPNSTWSAVANLLSGTWADCKITVDRAADDNYSAATEVIAVLGKN